MSYNNANTRSDFADKSNIGPASSSGNRYPTAEVTQPSVEPTTTETGGLPSGGAHDGFPTTQGSGNYPTSPTAPHRYGTNIGTGAYDTHGRSVAPFYTINESDFKHTAPDSGRGIHASQYDGRGSGQIPIGTITYIREHAGLHRSADPVMHTRASGPETDRYLREERRERNIPHREPEIVEERRHQGRQELETDTEREHRLKHERAHTVERGGVQQEKADSNTGIVQGLFNRNRRRDSPLAGRDTDLTDSGSKPAGNTHTGKDPLSSSGRVDEKEWLAKEQGFGVRDTKHHISPGATTGIGASTAAATGTGAPGVGSGIRGAEHQSTTARGASMVDDTAYGKSGRSDAGVAGKEGQRRDTELGRETQHETKPTLKDKVIGNAEVVVGKGTGNATMYARGKERAAGEFSKN